MGINRRADDRKAFRLRNERDAQAMADALATIEAFNARLATGREVWFWPTIGAALLTRHHWLQIACDGCDTIIDLDLSVKRRHPDAPVSVALAEARCPRCNGHGRLRVVGCCRFPG